MRNKRVEIINETILEAQRFIKRAKAWRMKLINDSMAEFGSVEGGACKRSSMELTRLLVKIRKPINYEENR